MKVERCLNIVAYIWKESSRIWLEVLESILVYQQGVVWTALGRQYLLEHSLCSVDHYAIDEEHAALFVLNQVMAQVQLKQPFSKDQIRVGLGLEGAESLDRAREGVVEKVGQNPVLSLRADEGHLLLAFFGLEVDENAVVLG